MILTDGESVLDDVTLPAKRLRDSQVEIFTIGIGSDALRFVTSSGLHECI